jgi:CheY-like chemotaxis protein
MCTRNINIIKELDKNLPKTMADRHQLQQVFINLIVNAQDALKSQKGNKTLSVKTKKIDNFIRIEITDSGPGIPSENLTRIFEPFFTTKDIGKGTGLGLSLSFGIVSEHGGRIWAENISGGGARFCMELPIIEDRIPPNGNKEKTESIFLKGQRVLIIDDEEQILKLIVRTCNLLNISSDTARDPGIARKKLETGIYDGILCDYRLPEQNGIELHNWAVKLRPALKNIWIFMTGSSESDDLLKTGCPVLKKPFSLETFQETLSTVLKKA